MGAKDSKLSFISYEDAAKRVSESELRRIREAFKRCAGSTSSTLSLEAFVHEVLCDGVPYEVADWLYQACGGTKRGITFKDLFCGVVVLTKGNIEEKIKFLWTLYTNNQNDNGTHIYKKDFAHALNVERTSLPVAETHRTVEILTSLFGANEKVTFEQFRSWLLIHNDATVLSKWLLFDRHNVVQDLDTPTFYQSLAGVTHLDEREIMELEKCFWSLRAAAGGALRVGGAGGVDTLLAPALGGAAAGLARALDDNCDAQVDFKELCCGLSAACRGPVTERLKFCFKIFDLDRDGLLNKRELIDMVGILCTVANEAMRNQGSRSSTPSTEDSESERGFDPEVILLNLRDKLVTITKEGRKPVFQLGPIDGNEISPAYQDVTKEETEEDDSIIGSSMCLSAEEFLIWSVESAEPLLTPFLELTFEACHVVLGLRPQCPHQERDIVLGWMRRAAGRGLAPGQLWYLVAADWWAAWLRHGAAPRACCRRAARLPDDDSLTTASTESMGSLLWRAETTSLGSAGGSSGVGSGGGGGGGSARAAHPGPVDNARLLAGGAARAPALTGEGGLLRRDVTLAQHRDFELLPDELWRALAQWYGAPHPLPRQVIRPPGGDVELELYPLQLDILRHAPNAQRTGPPERQLAYTAAFSRLATVKQVTEFLCGALGLARERVRLWLLRGEPGAAAEQLLLDDERPTLAELHPYSNARARLLLELRNADLTWPEEITALSLAGAGRAAERRETLAAPELAGATGLHNLGNTCFMNAALQAVWNTAALTRYFTADMHLREVNAANPLGTRGELALRFGELCKEVWSGGLRSVAPLRVRSCVARWARALAGGGQHDAQELLAWLLDALHEDLNRARPPAVAPTPVPLSAPHPTPAPAPAPLPDQVAAAEAWEQFSLRNSSVMTELFYGQLKSQVRCTCGRESVRFDTFNMLSLPLPLEAHVRAEVKVVRQDGSVPVRYGVRVSSDGTFAELRRVLAELCGLPADSLVLVEGGGSLAGREVAARAPVPAGARLLAYEAPSESDADSDSDTHTDQDAPANHDVHTDQNAHAHRDAHSDQDVQTDHDARSDHVHAEHFAPRRYHSLDAEASAGAAAGTEAAAEAEAGAAQVSARASSLCMPALFCFKRSRSESVMYHDGWGAVGPGGPGGARAAFGSSPADMQRAHLAVRGHTPLPALHPAPSRSPRFIFAVHRKQVGAEAYFVPWQRSRPAAFGAPLLVALRRGDSGRRLHARVWRQLARLLTPRPAPRAHNHAADCDDSLGYEFPFRLRVVDARGAWCALCAWPALCRGCLLPACDRALVCDARDVETGTEADAEVEAGAVRRLVRERLAGALLAVDWDPTALHLRYQPAEEQACVEHASVAESLAAAARPVDLASCLRAFTGEERLEQHYQCAACRAARPATKKLQLWRLPPVLIIHLKRFQYVNNKWVKSQKVVDFPYQDFDPTPYLASVPQETILRHNELKSLCDRRSSELLDLVETESEPEEAPEESRRSKVARRRRESPAGGRKRLESSSLTAAPVQDDNLVDYHQHRLEPERDPFDLKYNLYAVVAHSGELSGGHYVAYARHGSGAWLCYNDSACRVLPAPTLDPAAAYLLFYERRGLRASAYLPPAGGSPPPPAPAAAVPGCALT